MTEEIIEALVPEPETPKPATVELVIQDKLTLCSLEREFFKASLEQSKAQQEVKRTSDVITTIQSAYKETLARFQKTYEVPAGCSLKDYTFDGNTYAFVRKENA
jgi:hypothetical protein